MADCIDEQEAKEYQDHERLGAGQQQLHAKYIGGAWLARSYGLIGRLRARLYDGPLEEGAERHLPDGH